MTRYLILAVLTAMTAVGQGGPTFKTETHSAVVWEYQSVNSSPSPGWLAGFSSDPIHGTRVPTLFFDGGEVRFDVYEVHPEKLIVTFTFINNSDSPLTVLGSTFQSTQPLLPPKDIKKVLTKETKKAADTTDFYNRNNVTVAPGQLGTLWFPVHYRHTPGFIQLAAGESRYSIRVQGRDCVFVMSIENGKPVWHR